MSSVFSRFREHGGTAKCEIGFKHIDALGHLVGGDEMRPQLQKVDKILQARHPQVKKEMRSFLGMVGYHRKFVWNFDSIAKPLTDKTKKGEPNVISWDKESMQANILCLSIQFWDFQHSTGLSFWPQMLQIMALVLFYCRDMLRWKCLSCTSGGSWKMVRKSTLL